VKDESKFFPVVFQSTTVCRQPARVAPATRLDRAVISVSETRHGTAVSPDRHRPGFAARPDSRNVGSPAPALRARCRDVAVGTGSAHHVPHEEIRSRSGRRRNWECPGCEGMRGGDRTSIMLPTSARFKRERSGRPEGRWTERDHLRLVGLLRRPASTCPAAPWPGPVLTVVVTARS